MINIFKAEKLVGKVIHYFDKIGVAVIRVEKSKLKVGDTVKFKHGDKEFKQTIESLQVEREPVKKIGKGKEAGMKVNQEVKEGWEVYRV